MPSPDTLITLAILAFMALGMVLITTVPPGAYERFMRARRYHRSGSARHARRSVETAPLPALEAVPEPEVVEPAVAADDTSPWALPAVLVTIPDALKARTA